MNGHAHPGTTAVQGDAPGPPVPQAGVHGGGPIRKVRESSDSLKPAVGRRCFNPGTRNGDVQRQVGWGPSRACPLQSASLRVCGCAFPSPSVWLFTDCPSAPGDASVGGQGPRGGCGVRRLTGCKQASPGQRVPAPFRSRPSREGDSGQGAGGHTGSRTPEVQGWPGSALGWAWAAGSSPASPVPWRPARPQSPLPREIPWNLGYWEPQAWVVTLSRGLAGQADTVELDSLGAQDPQGAMEPG